MGTKRKKLSISQLWGKAKTEILKIEKRIAANRKIIDENKDVSYRARMTAIREINGDEADIVNIKCHPLRFQDLAYQLRNGLKVRLSEEDLETVLDALDYTSKRKSHTELIFNTVKNLVSLSNVIAESHRKTPGQKKDSGRIWAKYAQDKGWATSKKGEPGRYDWETILRDYDNRTKGIVFDNVKYDALINELTEQYGFPAARIDLCKKKLREHGRKKRDLSME